MHSSLTLTRTSLALWGNQSFNVTRTRPSRFLFAGPFCPLQQGPSPECLHPSEISGSPIWPAFLTMWSKWPMSPQCRIGPAGGESRMFCFYLTGVGWSMPFLNIYCSRSLAFG